MCIGVKVSDSPGTGSSDSCELPCGCWELNPGPLEEQSVLLTAEPFLQPPHVALNKSAYQMRGTENTQQRFHLHLTTMPLFRMPFYMLVPPRK